MSKAHCVSFGVLFPYWLFRRKRIVNVVSFREEGEETSPGYAMTKHAFLALHPRFAMRRLTGIRVTALPGYVETDMTSSFGVDPAIMISRAIWLRP